MVGLRYPFHRLSASVSGATCWMFSLSQRVQPTGSNFHTVWPAAISWVANTPWPCLAGFTCTPTWCAALEPGPGLTSTRLRDILHVQSLSPVYFRLSCRGLIALVFGLIFVANLSVKCRGLYTINTHFSPDLYLSKARNILGKRLQTDNVASVWPGQPVLLT